MGIGGRRFRAKIEDWRNMELLIGRVKGLDSSFGMRGGGLGKEVRRSRVGSG